MLSQHNRNDYPAITEKNICQIADFPVLNTTIKFHGSKAPYLHKGILEGVSPQT